MDCRTRLRLTKMISLDKTKIGPKPVRFFLPRLPQPLININRNAVLQRKGIEIATVLPTATGQVCLSPIGLWPHFLVGFFIILSGYEHLPSGYLFCLCFSQSLSFTLLAVSGDFSIASKSIT